MSAFAMAAAFVAVLCYLIGLMLHPMAAGFIIFIAVFSIITLLHSIFCASCKRWAEDVLQAFKCMANGTDLSRSQMESLTDFGPDIKRAIQDICESIARLRRDELRGETVLANMSDGIILVDSDRRVSLFNRAAGEILGRSPEKVIGNTLWDSDLHPEISRLAHDSVSGCEHLQAEIRLPGWPPRWVEVAATPFRDHRATEDCSLVMLRDISEIRRHERTQKEFVSNVSHELKTPITAVRTTAETLLSGAKNDEAVVDRFLNSIISESDRLSALIDDLMELARRDAGITRTERSEVRVADVVQSAIRVVEPAARSKNIELATEIPDNLAAVCDEYQMVQLIRNLADNAVKYTQDGGKVSVTADIVDDSLRIKVSDSGIGIPFGEVDRIFERFYRVDKARSRMLGGTGLGLAIVKSIVDAHEGKIEVDTQLGKGSTFTVTIPCGFQAQEN